MRFLIVLVAGHYAALLLDSRPAGDTSPAGALFATIPV